MGTNEEFLQFRSWKRCNSWVGKKVAAKGPLGGPGNTILKKLDRMKKLRELKKDRTTDRAMKQQAGDHQSLLVARERDATKPVPREYGDFLKVLHCRE